MPRKKVEEVEEETSEVKEDSKPKAKAKTKSKSKTATKKKKEDDKVKETPVEEASFDATEEQVDESQKDEGESKSNDKSKSKNTFHKNHNGKRQKRPTAQYEPSTSKEDLEKLTVSDLREKAGQLNIDASGMRKGEMIDRIYVALAIAEGFMEVTGTLDILPDGYGFLRMDGYLPSEHDVYVSLSTIRRNGLRKGDKVCGQTRPARSGEKFAAIQSVVSVNDTPLDEFTTRPKFSELTPIYPDERLLMEHGKDSITARVIDLVSPIGKGQRGLIVSPPKAGKTTILKDIAAAIHANNPEVYLMCLLVDERPEEVTDMQRSIHGEVISSTFDMPCENHIQVSELVIERAKRLVEMGKDVVILLDSITRLARAYNLGQPASGRVLSGGVDSTALYPPKRFLGAARNIEDGGSLTILASALIDTGSKMDEVIFEEFKGTGNMELKLDRNLADRRIFPAIDPITSGTRKEEILIDGQVAPLIWAVRSVLANLGNTERAMSMLIKSLRQTDTNQEFLIRSAKKAQNHVAGENFEL
jgi:transcription termination factor Rho